MSLQEGVKAHYRVKHSKNEFAKARNHINETVNVFTSLFLQLCSIIAFAKHSLAKFKGIRNLILHLKETELRRKFKLKICMKSYSK